MDAGEKVPGGFIIAGRDSSKLFELADEILDEMARLVHFSVKIPRRLATALGRNYWRLARRHKGAKPIRVRFVVS
jgi:hypothetical protein